MVCDTPLFLPFEPDILLLHSTESGLSSPNTPALYCSFFWHNFLQVQVCQFHPTFEHDFHLHRHFLHKQLRSIRTEIARKFHYFPPADMHVRSVSDKRHLIYAAYTYYPYCPGHADRYEIWNCSIYSHLLYPPASVLPELSEHQDFVQPVPH